MRLFGSVMGSGLPEQLLLLILESKDVLLVLIQRLQVSSLLGDLAVFIFFDLIAVLVDFDFFDVAFRRLLSPSGRCGIVHLQLLVWFHDKLEQQPLWVPMLF